MEGAQDGSVEAARWVADAIENAREWFPDMSEHELHDPLEQAFELAGRSVRGEREFHAVFEAELHRAIEERAVLGVAGSVLPAQSEEAPKAFPLVADNAEAAADPDPGQPPAAVPEMARSAGRDRARVLALAVGALRFHRGLSPEAIRTEVGIDAGHYAESVEWLLDHVDHTLDGHYPRHLDRRRMISHAAGLGSIEDAFAVERHVRECPGCATYLADLLDAATRTVEPTAIPRPGMPPTNPELFSYTTANTWGPDSASEGPLPKTPVMSIKAAELRKYAHAPEPADPTPPLPPAIHAIRRPHAVSRPFAWQRALVGALLTASVVALLALALVALSGDGDADGGSRQALAAAQSSRSNDHRQPTVHRSDRAEDRSAARKQAARKRARARARRAALRRIAAARRRAARWLRTHRPDPAAQNPPRTPSPPALAPATQPVNPQPPAPSGGSGGSSEFGIEP